MCTGQNVKCASDAADVNAVIPDAAHGTYPARHAEEAGTSPPLRAFTGDPPPMKLLAGTLAALCLSACASANDCSFTTLELSADPAAPAEFVGDGRTIKVRFVNENPDISDPDAFPEPPVVVLNKASGTRCSIEDGGIWARSPLLLSSDESRLLTYEFSGSSAELVAYDTATCVVVQRQDISGQRAGLVDGKLTLGKQCDGDDLASCKELATLPSHPFCAP